MIKTIRVTDDYNSNGYIVEGTRDGENWLMLNYTFTKWGAKRLARKTLKKLRVQKKTRRILFEEDVHNV